MFSGLMPGNGNPSASFDLSFEGSMFQAFLEISGIAISVSKGTETTGGCLVQRALLLP
jgi:hypothetical protein